MREKLFYNYIIRKELINKIVVGNTQDVLRISSINLVGNLGETESYNNELTVILECLSGKSVFYKKFKKKKKPKKKRKKRKKFLKILEVVLKG